MPRLEARLDILPLAQREIWPALRPAPACGLVLYGGTAVALRLGHRPSVDFDFFGAGPLDKGAITRAFAFVPAAGVLQDAPDTLVVSAAMPSGPVKVSFFGGLGIGHLNEPALTTDGVLRIASLEDLMATKLKATLDRAEARDYRDIAEMLAAGVALPRALSAFRIMFGGEPAAVLRALGYFADGDLPSLGAADRCRLIAARDAVRDLPDITIRPGFGV